MEENDVQSLKMIKKLSFQINTWAETGAPRNTPSQHAIQAWSDTSEVHVASKRFACRLTLVLQVWVLVPFKELMLLSGCRCWS